MSICRNRSVFSNALHARFSHAEYCKSPNVYNPSICHTRCLNAAARFTHVDVTNEIDQWMQFDVYLSIVQSFPAEDAIPLQDKLLCINIKGIYIIHNNTTYKWTVNDRFYIQRKNKPFSRP